MTIKTSQGERLTTGNGTGSGFMSFCLIAFASIVLASCSTIGGGPKLPDAPSAAETAFSGAPDYLLGPNDELEIFVWRAPELSTEVTVRPDGRISTPLVEDMVAAGKTPSQLASDLERVLSEFVKSPKVTVLVSDFSSTLDQQVRVIGQAQTPVALPYQAGMTVLDVMVAVGGLTEFAAGNRSTLYRVESGERKAYRLKLDNLLRKGQIDANVPVLPGDVILIPESVL